MAPRPRGGWQVGTSFARTQRAIAEYQLDDPAPDVYTVQRLAGGDWRVTHYRHRDDRQACCVREVTPRPGESEIETLARTYPPFALCARHTQET
jgi:hypothetical protein